MRNLAARRSPLAVMAIACVVCLSPRAHAQSGTLFGDWKIQIIDRLGHTEVESFRVGPTNRMGVRLHDGNNSLGQAAVVEIPSSTIATALTLPSGWTFSTATMTNGNGASCGWSDASGWAGISPIYWSSNSSFTRIADTVNNFTVGKAWALNSSGVTVGELAQNLTSEKRPLAYSPGIPELVRLDRGGLDQGVADAVNNAGVVVGHTYLTDGSSGRIVTWTPDNQGSYLSSLPVTISGWPTDRTGFAVGITEDGVIGGFVNPTWDGLNAGRPFVWSAQFGLKYIGYEGQYGVPTQFGKSGSDYEMSGNGQGNNAYPWLWIGSADPLGKGAVLDASAFQGPDQVAMMFTGFNPGDTGCFGGWIYTNIGLWASASTATALYDRYLLDPQNSNAVFVARGTVSSGGVNEALKPDATLLRVKASTADPESPLDPVTVEFQTTVPLTNHKNAFHCTARVNTNGLFAYHVEVFDWSINDWEVTGQAYMPSNFLTYNVFGGDLTLNGRKNYVRQTDGAVKARLRVKQVGSGPISQNWVVEVDQANWCYDKRTTE